MIKTLAIMLIIAGLIIFFLILALIGQLDDLCEYEKKIKKAIKYIKTASTPLYTHIVEILEGEDNDK